MGIIYIRPRESVDNKENLSHTQSLMDKFVEVNYKF